MGKSVLWAGGEHEFRLTLGGLEALQAATGSSPFAVLNRLQTQMPMVADVIDTLRLGLTGAGMDKAEARTLVTRAVDRVGLSGLILPAFAVLADSLLSPDSDAIGTPSGEPQGDPPPPENGGFPNSTATGQ
jgi:hypothetical protein